MAWQNKSSQLTHEPSRLVRATDQEAKWIAALRGIPDEQREILLKTAQRFALECYEEEQRKYPAQVILLADPLRKFPTKK